MTKYPIGDTKRRSGGDLVVETLWESVNDHPNGATHDRLNGAISSWPKSGFRTGFKLVQTSVFHPLSKCRFSMISDR